MLILDFCCGESLDGMEGLRVFFLVSCSVLRFLRMEMNLKLDLYGRLLVLWGGGGFGCMIWRFVFGF